MSYGPQLPPHLQKQRPPSHQDSDSDNEDQIGPKLPELACRGPKPAPASVEEEAIGPKLPGQAHPETSKTFTFYGPVIPTSSRPQEEDSSDDDDVIGPRPPKLEEEIDPKDALVMQFEERAKRMKEQIEGKNDEGLPKRETWMLELPPTMTKNFGLGARSFSTSTAPKTSQDKSWTRAPTDGPVKESEEPDVDMPTDERDVLEYMASLKRDEDMEKVANKLREKRGTESLMDKHSKKLKKEEEKSGRPKERRPFDRDIDLSANQFDEAKKKLMMKKAAQLNDRFSSGAQKFL